MKLLLDLASLRMRYYQRLNGNRLIVPQTIIDIWHTSAILVENIIKIKALSEDLFCTGDIETVNYCIEVYRQFLNNEPLDFFISGNWEIQLALQNIKRELFRFSEGLKDYLSYSIVCFRKNQNLEKISMTLNCYSKKIW